MSRLIKPSFLKAPALAGLCIASVVALIACGGGGSSDSPAASSFSSGPITGFGSVIVNGVRFDESSARISDDDGVSHVKGDLKLGMTAEIDGGQITTDDKGSHCTAKSIGFRSEIVGPVDAVDLTAKTLVVLGQPVDVTAITAFDDRLPSGLASVTVADVVEVYGTLDTTTGHYSATRIEPKANAPLFKLRGTVASLDTTAHTFQIGSELISYAGLAADKVPTGLANGLLVRVKLQTTQVLGAWVATKLQSAVQHVEDHDKAELKGMITAFTSVTQFSVDGIVVDASKASFPEGTTGIVLGARVEVEGSASGGVIVATKVSVETEDHARHGGFELHGAITALDTTAQTFSLRGLTVSYADAGVQFKDGTASQLAVGVQVEVKGVLSSDGTMVMATLIDFEH